MPFSSSSGSSGNSSGNSGSKKWLVRPADPEGRDDLRIGEILVNAFVKAYARKLPEVVVSDSRKADLRRVAEKRLTGTVLVAENGDKTVIGSVTLIPPGAPGSEAWTAHAADLRFLGVDPAYRGGGVAEALLDQAEALARSWACVSVELHVRRGALGVARLYGQRGYRREPAGDLDKPEIYLEAFQLTLGSNPIEMPSTQT
jgi:GNAT superfamily N-acetyltransferase